MGTSQSSSGSPSKTPIVPPWVPEIEPDINAENDTSNDLQILNENPKEIVAPSGRFSSARRNLNSFARDGDNSSMKRGVGQYIKKGYGGSKAAVSRFGGTIATGGNLYTAITKIALREPIEGFDPSDFTQSSSDEIVDRLIEVIRPIDGTQDTEATRRSIKTAFSALLEKDENIDLLNLSNDDSQFVIERFTSDDILRRLELDVGKSIQANATSSASAISRLKEIKGYIQSTVTTCFKKIINAGKKLSASTVRNIIKSVLADTFYVFEDYIK